MADSWRTDLTEAVAEGTTPVLTATLQAEVGAAVPLADMTSITLTLYSRNTPAVINGRNATNVMNSGIGTYHATSGLLTLAFTVDDTALLAQTGPPDLHIAMITYTWSGGAKVGRHEVSFPVANLAKVT